MLRFHTEFPNNSGILYRIEIHDADHTASSTEFAVDDTGFELNINNNNSQRHAPIIATDLTFGMVIADATHEQLITDLAGAVEDRFTVRILWDESDGDGFKLYWAGVVLPDISKMSDINYPYIFKVSATDGLGYLKKINYSDKSGVEAPYNGFARQISIIKKCLTEISYVPEVWPDENYFITAAINWRPDTVAYGPNNCPLYYVYNDQRAFWQRKEEGETSYMSCYDVLENICSIYGARIIQSQGVWRIEQIEIRRGGAFFARAYTYDLDAPAFIGITDDYDVGLTEQYKRLRGIEYTWYSALDFAKVVYNVYNRRNLIDGHVFSNETDLSLPERNLGQVNKTSDETKLKLSFIFSYTLKNNGWSGLPGDFLVKFQAKLKIGDWYAWRLADVDGYIVTYDSISWDNSGTTRTIEFVTQPRPSTSLGYDDTFQEVFEVVTTNLPTSGEVIFDVELQDLIMMSGQNEFDFQLTWQLKDKWLEIYDYGASVLQIDKITYHSDNVAEGNTESIETVVMMGDGTTLNSVGRLTTLEETSPSVYEYLNTKNWNIGSASLEDVLLLDLLADRILRGQRTPVRKMRCEILETEAEAAPYVHLPAYKALSYGGRNWIILGGRYQARTGVWSGEWFELNYDETSGVTNPLDPKTDPIGGGFPEQPLVGGGSSTGAGSHPGNVYPATLQPLACAYVSANMAAGAITSIPVDYALTENAFVAGEIVVLVNPANGFSATTTVTASSVAGDTSIAVSSVDLPVDFYIGAYVIKSPKTGLQNGSTGPANLWVKGTGSNIYRKSGNVGVGNITTPVSKLEVLAGSSFVERVVAFNSSAGSIASHEFVNTNTAGSVLISLDEVQSPSSYKGYIIRRGSTHATEPNKLSIVQAGAHEIAIANNGADRIRIGTDGGVNILAPIMLSGSAGTSGQVLTSSGPGAVPAWGAISLGSTAAESGTGIVSGKVRLGINALLADTVINQGGFDYYSKNGKYAVVRNDVAPVARYATLQVEGAVASPVNISTPSEDSVMILQGYSGGLHANNVLSFGLFSTATNGAWLQGRNQNTPNTYYPIILNPRGGKLAYNRLTPSSAQVTLSYDSTGSLLSNTILYVEGGDTNTTPKIAFGLSGSYSGGIGYWGNSGNNIMRLYNAGASGSRSVRIAVGSETNDVMIVTELGYAGFGHSSPTTIHSNVHSAGSMAAKSLETFGAPTIGATEHVIVYTGSTNQTYNLPSATTCDGRWYQIWNHSASSTITLSSSVTKASGSSFNTIAAGQFAFVVSVGGVWRGYKVTSL